MYKNKFWKKNDIPKCFSPRLEFLKISNELFKLKYRTNKKRSNSKNSRNKTNSTSASKNKEDIKLCGVNTFIKKYPQNLNNHKKGYNKQNDKNNKKLYNINKLK